ncbi:MAG: methyltransferase domain-containing protein [Bacteroidetes bacterium]|nr:methyltransferase domain-containing protein [Bacteroidota bacterium]
MTEIELLVDLHLESERQGPGSIRETLKALDCMDLPRDRMLSIADIGCGSGGQTMTLAQHVNGHITAVDIFPEFLDGLNEKSRTAGLSDTILTLKRSMDDLRFSDEQFDIIWSEGAIYNIGFERGIREWRPFLKAGGYAAISEITWITQTRPPEIEDYWKKEYPEIDTAPAKIALLEKYGYSLTGYFHLTQESWMENFYRPLEARFEAFLERHRRSPAATKVVDDHRTEIDLYRRYKEYYSYGFYIARKDRT